ncbi:hypothetical protein [Shewanella sp. SM96]|uniref:hypothetical protein n=1 Tax=Shewanella TaxID=22 RepID=UPI0021D9A927|nr:hypothetical protein [Shewanella sp. SM96]MCU8005806.1 hypothetical protein [Shewanella sp. SM96]
MRKSSQQQPFWFYPATIHHELDKDIVDSIRRGNEKCTSMMMMDPHFEYKTYRYHIEWTDKDINTLLEGMLVRSLEILRNADPNNELFKEEIMWQSSPQFAAVCQYFGYDPRVIREEVCQIMKRYGKAVVIDHLSEFVHWTNIFAEMFKYKIVVKSKIIAGPSIISELVQHANGDHDLLVLLRQISELMDDLYLSGCTTRKVMNEFIVNAINQYN